MNEVIVKQDIENSIKMNLNEIIRRQTEGDTLYSINVSGIARKLSGPILSIAMSLTANLITPSIQNFLSNVRQVEEQECIEITHDEALSIMITAVDCVPDRNISNSQLVALFDDEYYKLLNK